MATQLKAAQRKAQIFAQAELLAGEKGLYALTLDQVAAAAGCSRPTVIHYYRSMQGLRNAIVEQAIEKENLRVIAQALAAYDPLINTLGEDLKRRALLTLA